MPTSNMLELPDIQTPSYSEYGAYGVCLRELYVILCESFIVGCLQETIY